MQENNFQSDSLNITIENSSDNSDLAQYFHKNLNINDDTNENYDIFQTQLVDFPNVAVQYPLSCTVRS